MGSTPLSPEVSIIAEMVTPALLILACGSLLGTSLARLGRVVDFVRKLSQGLESSAIASTPAHRETLARMEMRAGHLETSITSYYVAVTLFVLTCLAIAADRFLEHRFYWAPVAAAICGLLALLVGSAFMIAECRLAVEQVRSEVLEVRERVREVEGK